MKIAIIYRSFLGTTRQYAEWLAEDVGGEVLAYRQADPGSLAAYDAFVIMSGTYASWMPLVAFLKKKWDFIKGKKVAVVAVGAVPAEDQASISAYERIPEYIRLSIKYFKLPGRMGQKTLPIGSVARENLEPVADFIRS